jgi:hypothetical protein
MATVDFWIELSPVDALRHCETAAARSVAFELSWDDRCPARVSHSGTGDLMLRLDVGDLEDVVDCLRYCGYEVLMPEEAYGLA